MWLNVATEREREREREREILILIEYRSSDVGVFMGFKL